MKHLSCNSFFTCFVSYITHFKIILLSLQTNGSKLLQGKRCTTVEGSPAVTFWVYFIVRALADIFPSLLISLLDALVLTMVSDHKGDYGRQKMFGLVAVGEEIHCLYCDGHTLCFPRLSSALSLHSAKLAECSADDLME